MELELHLAGVDVHWEPVADVAKGVAKAAVGKGVEGDLSSCERR